MILFPFIIEIWWLSYCLDACFLIFFRIILIHVCSSMWDWPDAQLVADFPDARTLASESWNLDQVCFAFYRFV